MRNRIPMGKCLLMLAVKMASIRGGVDLDTMFYKNGYKLGDKLGKGSFAVVKKAIHVASGKELAVKIVDHHLATKEFLEKFLSRELNIIRTLKHPNIIDVDKVVRIGRFTCVIMEQAKKGDLLEHILGCGSLSETDTKKIFRGIVRALQFCHSKNVAHRDLKCENILLDENFEAKLSDFGFARSVIDLRTRRRQLSKTYCGSAAYVAPEVLKGTPYNPMLSDAWSLGVILFIAVTGLMPFDDSDIPKMLQVQTKKKWTFPSSKTELISQPCQQVIKRTLEPDAMSRMTVNQVVSHEWLK